MKSLMLTALVLLAGAAYVDAQKHVAEVYFIVDPQVVQRYIGFGYSKTKAITTIKGDIKYFMYQTNEMFKSTIKYGLNMEIRSKKLEFLTKPLFESCKLIRKNELQADVALEVMMEWLKNTDAHNTIGYDIAVVWTGFDLFGSVGQKSVLGYATQGAACKKDNSVAVVEFDGLYKTAITTAHEIAHSLGSGHDVTQLCGPSGGYIMAEKTGANNIHRWEFSVCSATDIRNYINKLNNENNNCLLKTSARAQSFQMSSQAGRDIIDPQKTCERAIQIKSSVCAGAHLYNVPEVKGDVICQKLFCTAKTAGACSIAVPADGMVCDQNKRCLKGTCVFSTVPTPKSFDADCMWGDSSVVFNTKYNCKQMTQKTPSICYKARNRRLCCHSCKSMKTGMPGCEYGDRNPSCSNYEPSSGVCQIYSDSCCKLCINHVGKRSILNDVIPQANLTADLTMDIHVPIEIEVIEEDDSIVTSV